MAMRRTYTKGLKMNCWESLFIQIHQQQGILIEEQKANDFKPIYALANVTGLYRDRITKNRFSFPVQSPASYHTGDIITRVRLPPWFKISESRYLSVIHTIEILLVITGFDPQGILYQTQISVYKATTYKINTNYATIVIK
jgi:hypothetical protein